MKNMESLSMLSWLAVLKENLGRVENAFLDTDARQHIEGARILRKEIDRLGEFIENEYDRLEGKK